MLECLIYVGKHWPNSLGQTWKHEAPKAEKEIYFMKVQISKRTVWESEMALKGWVIFQQEIK